MDTYPNDPHINDTMGSYGWGQLTNVNILLFTFQTNLCYESDLTVINWTRKEEGTSTIKDCSCESVTVAF